MRFYLGVLLGIAFFGSRASPSVVDVASDVAQAENSNQAVSTSSLMTINPFKCVATDKNTQMSCESQQIRWRTAIFDALERLPLEFLPGFPANRLPVTFSFTYDPIDGDEGYDAGALGKNVYIKLVEDWSFTKYTRDDFTAMILHEIAHVYPDTCATFVAAVGRESPPTKYAVRQWKKKGVCDDDFAESFMLYVVGPGYLKKYFPRRYEFVHKILKVVYKQSQPIPEFVQQRLTRPWHNIY